MEKWDTFLVYILVVNWSIFNRQLIFLLIPLITVFEFIKDTSRIYVIDHVTDIFVTPYLCLVYNTVNLNWYVKNVLWTFLYTIWKNAWKKIDWKVGHLYWYSLLTWLIKILYLWKTACIPEHRTFLLAIILYLLICF